VSELTSANLDHLVAQLTAAMVQLPADVISGPLDTNLRTIVDRAVVLAEAEIARSRMLQPVKSSGREAITAPHGFDEIIGDSAPLREALARVQIVSSTSSTVLLLGETGTGKELFARAIHDRSARRRRPLVRVNCAALPAALIETELFGHERGAFTGAVAMRQGRFELADKTTIFLDEIGDLPLELQAKLLRVVQEGEFERVGSSQTRKVDVRIIAATHRNLEEAVKAGQFREDLYYRLSVFPIDLPALRHRRDDIPRLVWFLVRRRQRALGRQIERIPDAVMQTLQDYDWPGNVRELENVIERAMIRSAGRCLELDAGLGRKAVPLAAGAGDGVTLASIERRHIEDILRRCQWRINGPSNAAARLGLHPSTLRFRLQKLGIARPIPASSEA